MDKTSEAPSLVRTVVLSSVFFVGSVSLAMMISYVPGALGLIDDYRLGRLMAPYIFLAVPFLFAGSVYLSRRHHWWAACC